MPPETLSPTPAPRRYNRRVLIVDDDDHAREDLAALLRPAVAEPIDDVLSDQAELIFGLKTAPAPPRRRRLHPEGFDVATAADGLSGVRLAAEANAAGTPFAMAFVDMRMPPGIDGAETVERLWQIDPHLQVVVCTAYADAAWADTLDRIGGGDNLLVLKKPYEPVEVCQLAATLTRKSNDQLCMRRRVTKLIHQNELQDEALDFSLTHDATTGLLNTQGLTDTFATWQRETGTGARACLQIHFARYHMSREALGNEAGGRILRLAADRIEAALAPLARHGIEAAVGRTAEGTFTAILRGAEASQHAADAAFQIRRAGAHPYVLEDGHHAVFIPPVIGVVREAGEFLTWDALQAAACVTRREAASQTRSSTGVAFRTNLYARQARRKLDAEAALIAERVEVDLDPVIDRATGQTVALRAWGRLPLDLDPRETADQTPRSIERAAYRLARGIQNDRQLHHLVVAAAARARLHRDTSEQALPLIVTTPGDVAAAPGWVEQTRRSLDAVDLDPSQIILDAVPGLVPVNPATTAASFGFARELGARVAVSMGGGHSFALLGMLEADLVTLLPGDVATLHRAAMADPTAARFRVMLAAMAEALDRPVLAELPADIADIRDHLDPLISWSFGGPAGEAECQTAHQAAA